MLLSPYRPGHLSVSLFFSFSRAAVVSKSGRVRDDCSRADLVSCSAHWLRPSVLVERVSLSASGLKAIGGSRNSVESKTTLSRKVKCYFYIEAKT